MVPVIDDAQVDDLNEYLGELLREARRLAADGDEAGADELYAQVRALEEGRDGIA